MKNHKTRRKDKNVSEKREGQILAKSDGSYNRLVKKTD